MVLRISIHFIKKSMMNESDYVNQFHIAKGNFKAFYNLILSSLNSLYQKRASQINAPILWLKGRKIYEIVIDIKFAGLRCFWQFVCLSKPIYMSIHQEHLQIFPLTERKHTDRVAPSNTLASLPISAIQERTFMSTPPVKR